MIFLVIFPFTQVMVARFKETFALPGKFEEADWPAILRRVSLQSSPNFVLRKFVEFRLSEERLATIEGEE